MNFGVARADLFPGVEWATVTTDGNKAGNGEAGSPRLLVIRSLGRPEMAALGDPGDAGKEAVGVAFPADRGVREDQADDLGPPRRDCAHRAPASAQCRRFAPHRPTVIHVETIAVVERAVSVGLLLCDGGFRRGRHLVFPVSGEWFSWSSRVAAIRDSRLRSTTLSGRIGQQYL